jgi:predicted nicotinamide N-methyase
LSLKLGRFTLSLECVETFDAVLDSFAESHPDNTEMIPYFADLWPSAKALSLYVQTRFDSLSGMRVMELGAGLGVPAIVAGMMGGEVTASDFHPDNLPYLRANADLNGIERLSAIQMDWRYPDASQQYDLILGSDLLYEQQQVETLTTCVDRLLRPGGLLLLADPMRKPLQSAFDRLDADGYKPDLIVRDEIAIIEGRKPEKPRA